MAMLKQEDAGLGLTQPFDTILGSTATERLGLQGQVAIASAGGGGGINEGQLPVSIIPPTEIVVIDSEAAIPVETEVVVPKHPPREIIPPPLPWVKPAPGVTLPPNLPTLLPSTQHIWTAPIPAGTFRAQSIEDCFSVSGMIMKYVYEYSVGTDASGITKSFSIRNKSVTNKIKVTLNIPGFLRSDAPTEFLIDGDSNRTITLSLDEAASLNLVMQNLKLYSEPTVVSVEVQDVTGPVYVKAV